jgi:hypothetical protein
MGILDVLLGRTKPAAAKIDALFGLPGATIQLDASEGLVPTKSAGVCYKPMAGMKFSKTEEEMRQLLGLSSTDGDDAGGTLRYFKDKYGYEWVLISASDFENLVNQVHVVNTTLEEDGFGPSLLCSVFGFEPGPDNTGERPGKIYLVYLYKRGTFYPFAPVDKTEKRDLEQEMKLEIVLKEDLKIEPEKERWMPLWGIPIG